MSNETLEKGDWIVHKQHGVGQIKAIEQKTIAGNERKYFRVKMSNGIYWLPINKLPGYVRSVSSRYRFYKVLRLIRKAPQKLPKDYKKRDKEIAARLEDATLEGKGELIRDLFGRRQNRMSLSSLNEKQFTELSKQFVREMTVVLNIEKQDAEKRLAKALQESLSKVVEVEDDD